MVQIGQKLTIFRGLCEDIPDVVGRRGPEHGAQTLRALLALGAQAYPVVRRLLAMADEVDGWFRGGHRGSRERGEENGAGELHSLPVLLVR